MTASYFIDDAPEEVFRLVTLRKSEGREFVHTNLFALKSSAEAHASRVVENGGTFISLTRYKKAENHDFKKAAKLVGFSEGALPPEPYPNARN